VFASGSVRARPRAAGPSVRSQTSRSAPRRESGDENSTVAFPRQSHNRRQQSLSGGRPAPPLRVFATAIRAPDLIVPPFLPRARRPSVEVLLAHPNREGYDNMFFLFFFLTE